ncbi:MAG: 3-(cis-5,6-dihydroxycyclohexa-1,3-dien-1-yl)propanoate dehydrogenase [Geminicoccaceae bacterium]
MTHGADLEAEIALRLREAEASGNAIAPIRDELGEGDIEAAYRIQQINTRVKLAGGGRIVGRKIGLTSKAVQQQLGVDRPDFGVLLDNMAINDGEEVPVSRILQPKVEAEVAFVMGRPLEMLNPSAADVLRATEFVVPAIEIVGSRIDRWNIKIVDTIADNASSGLFVLGNIKRRLEDADDLRSMNMEMRLGKEFGLPWIGSGLPWSPRECGDLACAGIAASGRSACGGRPGAVGCSGPDGPGNARELLRGRIERSWQRPGRIFGLAAMNRLAGEVALVTGGGSGLGRAIVERFVAEGARVAVLEVSNDKCATLTRDFGDSVLAIRGDATRLADNRRAVARTLGVWNKLDCFIANAGLWDFDTPLERLSEAAIDRAFVEVFAINVKAGLFGARAAVDALRSSRGSLIYTLSNAAFYPGGGGPIYTASKHALVGLVRQLAYELAPEVRVNGVAPAGMATDLRGPKALGLADTAYNAPADMEGMRLWSPLEIVPEPKDYAGHYALLASRTDGAVVTGAIHVCDTGGATAAARKWISWLAGPLDERSQDGCLIFKCRSGSCFESGHQWRPAIARTMMIREPTSPAAASRFANRQHHGQTGHHGAWPISCCVRRTSRWRGDLQVRSSRRRRAWARRPSTWRASARARARSDRPGKRRTMRRRRDASARPAS